MLMVAESGRVNLGPSALSRLPKKSRSVRLVEATSVAPTFTGLIALDRP